MRKRPLDEGEEERFVEALKYQWEEEKYKKAQPGDHLLTPFEYD